MRTDTRYCCRHNAPYQLDVGCQACRRGVPGVPAVPTPETIRAMDGPELTRLAYALGLAPEGAMAGWPGPEDIYANRDIWEPHRDLEEASVIFRGLRPRGWKTLVVGGPAGGATCGAVWAECLTSDAPPLMVPWDGGPAAEAHALLLCAVLAMAAGKETDGHEHDTRS